MQLILASGSPRRRELLVEAGYEFEVVTPSPSAECGACSSSGPAELVAELAVRKAADVVHRIREAPASAPRVVIAADTLAECQGSILGKPGDQDHARQMLQLLRGREHRVYTGLCVWPLATEAPARGAVEYFLEVDTTTLRMDTLSSAQIEEYLASNLWVGKAGAFGYQDRLGWVHVVQGSPSNVVGLPMERLATMLAVAAKKALKYAERNSP